MALPPPATTHPANAEDVRWFVDNVHAHDKALKGYLRQSFPALRDIDDVAQESYLRIWRQHAVDPIRSARALLFRIAQHLALDLVRRHRRAPVVATDSLETLPVIDAAPGAADVLGRKEKLQLVIAAIDALPSRCREVVVLRKLHLRSQRDIAEQLGISEKGVENHLIRGMERCRDFLRARGIEDLFRDGA